MAEKKKILLTAPWMPAALAALKRDYTILFPSAVPPKRDELLALLKGADAFCPVFTDAVDRALIEALPESVRIIASFGVGIDHIDLQAAKVKGIAVSNTPEVLSDDTADIAMGLIVAAMRGFYRGEKLVRDGNWTGAGISSELGASLTGKTLGIVGLGRIGAKVAKRARAFDMKVLYLARNRKEHHEKNIGVKHAASLRELLEKSDVVSLHCDLNPVTRHMINAKTLHMFKPGAYLINTGRGALIDEAALVTALKEGPLAGAGLDVYEFEPKVAEDLAAMANVTLLPHLGSATVETRIAMGLRVKENLDAFFNTGEPKDRVV